MKKLALVLFFAFVTLVVADKYDDWLNDVRAIITKTESDAFKKLKTDQEKEKFIQEFWAKRDPSPGTPENEYKTEYEQAVATVNSKIPAHNRKGSQTDLGITVLLLGSPDEQKKEGGEQAHRPSATMEEGEQTEAPAAGSNKMTFVYRKLPAEIASGEVQIQFVADPNSGEWKFADKKNAEPILDKARQYRLNAPQRAQVTGTPQTGQQGQQTTQAAPPSAGAAVTTPELKAALDAATSGTGPKDVTFNYLVDAFLDSKDTPFLAVAAGGTGDMSAARVGVRVLDASGTTVKETEFPFVTAGEAAGYFQTEIPVTAAGEYNVVVALANAGKAGAMKQAIKTPNAGALGLSSIILANSFSQLPEAKPEGVAYTFGKIKVQPTLDHSFEKTAPNGLIIVYEAYNFQLDPTTQKPNMEVVYQFQKDEQKPQKTEPAAPNGLVTGKKITIPTSFPLSNFPAGNYKLTITLTDKGTGQTATRETSFTVK